MSVRRRIQDLGKRGLGYIDVSLTFVGGSPCVESWSRFRGDVEDVTHDLLCRQASVSGNFLLAAWIGSHLIRGNFEPAFNKAIERCLFPTLIIVDCGLGGNSVGFVLLEVFTSINDCILELFATELCAIRVSLGLSIVYGLSAFIEHRVRRVSPAPSHFPRGPDGLTAHGSNRNKAQAETHNGLPKLVREHG